MDRQSERDIEKQWKNWEKERDEELKRRGGRGEACLSGVDVVGGLSEEVSAVEQIEAD